MSYVRLDDEYLEGRLSELRQRLEAEIRLQSGDREFHIFQDRNDITWGQNWQERLNAAIQSTTFLIPIVTPAFFLSPACRDEFGKFLAHEKTVGRNDLV